MKIVQEKVDGEYFLELSINLSEYEMIRDYMIISKKCYIKGEETFIGIKLNLDSEEEDIYEEELESRGFGGL